MKWLIFLILIGCGKHKEPVSLDLRDSDGDQIQNHHEGEFEKYVADFPRLEKVYGIIKFTTHQQEEISFSNHTDLKEDTLKLVTGDDTSLQRDQFFSEWSVLKLLNRDKKFEVSGSSVTLHLHFGPTEVKPDELVLVGGKAEKHLGQWSDYMRVNLSKEEFNGLMKGKNQIALRKKFPKSPFYRTDAEETIRSKTYKVHTFDGTKSKVLYVSKELSFERLKDFLNIDEITIVTDEFLFFNSKDQGGKRWFQRDYPNGNKAIALYSIQDLKSDFRKKFDQKKVILERVNGVPTTSLVLQNNMNSKVYMIIRPSRTMRTFEEYTEVTSHRSGSARQGSDESWKCIHYMRRIKSSSTVITPVEEFVNNLNEKFEENLKLLEQNDEKGIFWEIMLNAPEANLTLTLAGLNSTTFTTTGEHYRDCGYKGKGGTAAIPTNIEGKLTFEIETFVEKIQ